MQRGRMSFMIEREGLSHITHTHASKEMRLTCMTVLTKRRAFFDGRDDQGTRERERVGNERVGRGWGG